MTYRARGAQRERGSATVGATARHEMIENKKGTKISHLRALGFFAPPHPALSPVIGGEGVFC